MHLIFLKIQLLITVCYFIELFQFVYILYFLQVILNRATIYQFFDSFSDCLYLWPMEFYYRNLDCH